jgi:hypothetical protein
MPRERKAPVFPKVDSYFLTFHQVRELLPCTPKTFRTVERSVLRPMAVQFCDCPWDQDARPWLVCDHYTRRARWRIDDITERWPQLNPAPELGEVWLTRYRARRRMERAATAGQAALAQSKQDVDGMKPAEDTEPTDNEPTESHSIRKTGTTDDYN